MVLIHMGDVNELGDIVAGAFAHPEEVGHGEYLPHVGDFLSINQVVETLNRQGHHLFVTQVPADGWPAELVNTFRYLRAHTYLGSESPDGLPSPTGSRAGSDHIRSVGTDALPGWARSDITDASRD